MQTEFAVKMCLIEMQQEEENNSAVLPPQAKKKKKSICFYANWGDISNQAVVFLLCIFNCKEKDK